MSQNQKIKIGISCGDFNGVGLEILIKSFLQDSSLFDVFIPVLYSPLKSIDFYKKLYQYNNFYYQLIQTPKDSSLKKLNVIDFSNNKFNINPGKSSKNAGKIALSSLDFALKDLRNGQLDCLVTLPVNKHNISLNQNSFIGHTEYLLKGFKGVENLMLLCSKKLKIATLTNHIPISEVSKSINAKLIKKKIKILITSLVQDFAIFKPKLAVLALNPHGGDNGLIGDEDLKIVSPVIKDFVKYGDRVSGPYAADGFFGSGNYKNFDAILAMYHDQALIPFKSISFGSGVNYTAGMPLIRVSPDHGVGYDIAGNNSANINSFLSAIFLARDIYNNRLRYFNSDKKTT